MDAFTIYHLLPYGAAIVAAYLASVLTGTRNRYDERVKAYTKVLQLVEEITLTMDWYPESPISDKTMSKFERLVIVIDMFGRKKVRTKVQVMRELLHGYGYGNRDVGDRIIEAKANMREAMLRDIGRRRAIGVARKPLKGSDIPDEQ